MKRHYPALCRAFSLAAGLCWLGNLYGQQVLINEDFNAFPNGSPALPHGGWVNNIISGDVNDDQWIFDNPAGRFTSAPINGKFAIFDSDYNSPNSSSENVALESPSFSTTGFGKVSLKFDQYFDGIYNNSDSIVVEVYDGTTWFRVYSYNGFASITNSQNLDVSSYIANKSVAKVRFRFVGDWSFYWIVDNVRVEGYFSKDAGILAADFTSGNCGHPSDSIDVTVVNAGLDPISNFMIEADINGTLGGSAYSNNLSYNFAGTLNPSSKADVRLPGINTAAGGTITLTAWVEYIGDQNTSNDTIIHQNLNFLGVPSAPTASNGQRCGTGTYTLQAGGVGSNDSVIWFDASGSTQLAVGQTFETPVLGAGTHDFKVAAARGAGSGNLATTFAAGNGQSGAMFDVKPFKNISVDSFEVSFDQGTQLVEVYYREGGYAGFETNPSAWTLVGSATVTSTLPNGGAGIYVNVGNSIEMEAGKTYAIYVQLPNSQTINYTNGAFVFNNSDLQIEAGVGCTNNFGGTFSPRTFNGSLFYSYLSCLSPLTSVQVTVDPRPAGVEILKGSPFNGQFSTGTLSSPHIVADGDEIVLELNPPTGPGNAGFGTDWIISALNIHTLGGSPVPTGDTAALPPITGNAQLSFTPSISLSDSMIEVRVSVLDLNTGCDTTLTKYIFVAPRPDASYTAISVCNGDSVKFDNQSTILSGSMQYEWSFGDGQFSTLDEPVHVYSDSGSYMVILKAVSNFGYVDYDTQTVYIKPIPPANFSFQNACEGQDLVFTNTTLMPSGTPSFHWDFGDGNTLTTQNATHTYAQHGYYLVTYTVEVNGCVGSITKGVTQSDRAVVDFNALAECNNSEVEFENLSTLSYGQMGFRWKFGDGHTSTIRDALHDYSGFGTFDVTLVVTTDMGCMDSITKQISLVQAPEIAISYSELCAGQEISFTNNSITPPGGSNSYFWSFGDGKTSTQENPTHTYPGVGKYFLELYSEHPNGCRDTFHTLIILNEKPMAGIVGPATVCLGSEAAFYSSSAASDIGSLSYAWDFGNGIVASGTDTSILYGSLGTYPVNLITWTPGGCSDTAAWQVEVVPVPSSDFSFTSTFDGNGTFQFLAAETAAGTSYQWFFNDGGKATTLDPVHQFAFDGSYSVNLITTNPYGCSSKTVKTVQVLRTGIAEEEIRTVLYPNPNKGRFVLQFENGQATDYQLVVVNALGQEVNVNTEISDSRTIQVDLGQASPGVYFIQIRAQDGSVSNLKVTIQ